MNSQLKRIANFTNSPIVISFFRFVNYLSERNWNGELIQYWFISRRKSETCSKSMVLRWTRAIWAWSPSTWLQAAVTGRSIASEWATAHRPCSKFLLKRPPNFWKVLPFKVKLGSDRWIATYLLIKKQLLLLRPFFCFVSTQEKQRTWRHHHHVWSWACRCEEGQDRSASSISYIESCFPFSYNVAYICLGYVLILRIQARTYW